MKKINIILMYLLISILSFTKNEIIDDYKDSLYLTKEYIKYNSYNPNLINSKEMSNKMFDRLSENLDPSKMFITKKDIDEFKYLNNFYSSISEEDLLNLGNQYIKRYLEKVEKQYKYAIQLVKEYNFDFYTNNKYIIDREEISYEKNEKELNSLWEKRVLNDVIRLKLSDKSKEEIKKILLKRYNANMKNTFKMTEEEKNSYIINSFVEVYDPHNRWYGYYDAKDFEISQSLSLVGMGVSIQQRGEGAVISKIIKGSPAEKSNAFFVGDQYVYVGQGDDGELVDVTSYRVKDLVKIVRGKAGTVVRIGVRRDENSPVRIIRLVRDVIKQEDEQISTKIIEIDDKKVGYILIPSFYYKDSDTNEGINVSEDLFNAINDLKAKNVESMVVDLRNNGGGSLREVIKMVGYFIGEDKVAVQVKNADGSVVKYKTKENKIWDKPLIVMINRTSASASEIFSGAIKDYKRGVIVGTNSWGKGSVQTIRDMLIEEENSIFNLGLFKYTIQMFFRPSGKSTQIKGVEPDIEFIHSKYDSNYGEYKYKNALKWEKIPSQVDKQEDLKSISKLKKLHESRILYDKKWQLLKEEIQFSDIFSDRKEISLNINDRLKEREYKKEKQKYFEKESKKLGIPIETVFVLDNGLSYNEEDIETNLKREEVLKKYIDPQTYEAARISLDLIK